jgi:hypothetical protein
LDALMYMQVHLRRNATNSYTSTYFAGQRRK